MADISITAANVAPSTSGAATLDPTRLAGATITAGQTVYLDLSTNTWKLLDADAAAPVNGVGTTIGIAVNGAASGQPITICTKDPSFTLGGTVNAGDSVFASANAGGMTKTFADVVTGMFTTVLGIGIGSNKINFNPLQSAVAHA